MNWWGLTQRQAVHEPPPHAGIDFLLFAIATDCSLFAPIWRKMANFATFLLTKALWNKNKKQYKLKPFQHFDTPIFTCDTFSGSGRSTRVRSPKTHYVSSVASSQLARCWMRDSPRTGSTLTTATIYKRREQAILQGCCREVAIVSCCHSVKLPTLAAPVVRSQQVHAMKKHFLRSQIFSLIIHWTSLSSRCKTKKVLK